MGAISQTNVNLVGSHCGVSIGTFFLIYLFCWLCGKANSSLTLPSTPSVLRRRWSFPDGPGRFGHVPRHPNMHCVLPEWRRVHRKGSRAVGKHKGESCRYCIVCVDDVEMTSSSNLCCCSQGICFIRTSRPDTAVLYSPDEKFEVGVAKVTIKHYSVVCFVVFSLQKI